MTRATYERWLVDLMPPAFQGERGTAMISALGAALEVELQRAKLIMLARLLKTAPTSALNLLGEDRQISRYPDEPAEAFRARALAAWETYPWGGTIRGLIEALRAAGYNNVTVEEHWRTDPSIWAEFSVRLDESDAYLTAIRWDSELLWDDGHYWDADLAPHEQSRVIEIINSIKPARSKLRNLHYVYLPGFTWDETDPCWDEPGVTWDTLIDWSPGGP